MGAWKKIAGAFVDFDDETEGEKVEDSTIIVDDSADIEKLLSDLNVGDTTATTTPATTTNVPVLPGIQPDKPFSEIYGDQGVITTAKSAEEILAVMDGMAALPPEVRKISLDAMDQADSNWTMDDVKLDAKNKIAALNAYKLGLDTALSKSEADMNADLNEQDQYMTAATTQIRDNITELQRQIEEMQTLLQTEITESTQRKADIKSGHDTSVNAHAHECARVDQEIARLSTL